MRPQPLAGEQIAGSLAVIGHADWNVDRSAIEAGGEPIGNVAAEPDLVKVAVEKDSNPALAEAVEAQRPQQASELTSAGSARSRSD